jgi:hypothetical protein
MTCIEPQVHFATVVDEYIPLHELWVANDRVTGNDLYILPIAFIAVGVGVGATRTTAGAVEMGAHERGLCPASAASR